MDKSNFLRSGPRQICRLISVVQLCRKIQFNVIKEKSAPSPVSFYQEGRTKYSNFSAKKAALLFS